MFYLNFLKENMNTIPKDWNIDIFLEMMVDDNENQNENIMDFDDN